MQIDRERWNGGCYGSEPLDHACYVVDLETTPGRRSRTMTPSTISPSSSVNSFSGANGVSVGVGVNKNFIEHSVSKMDTLAGVAIKYGVEVADIKKMNGLVTDLQMFALKSLQIPLPGRHPPSPIVSNDSAASGENSNEQNQSRRACFDILESLESLKFESPQRNVSPAMSSLQGYYQLKPQKLTEEGTEMSVYGTGRSHCLEGGPFVETSTLSEPPPGRHRKCRSLVNGFSAENSGLFEDVSVVDTEAEKLNKSVRRRQKAETELNIPVKEDTVSSRFFSAITGKGLALRSKSTNRIAIAAEANTGWLSSVPMGLGDSLANSFFDGVRKSSSTSNLQDQESNTSRWTTSRWSLKPDLQAFSTASLAGLPKPMSSRRSKAALD